MANYSFLILTSVDMKKFKHAEHVAFHSNVRDIINAATASKIGLATGIFNPYLQAITQEQDIVNKAAGSSITQEMEKADAERDNVYRRIRRKLEVAKYENPASEAFKAWDVIEKHLLTPYSSNVPHLAMQEETAVLTGFVQDCRNQLTGEQVEALGIDGDLDDLEEKNQAFSALYQQRVAEKADSSVVTALQLRAATDVAYNQVVVALNALGNDPDPAKAEQVGACRSVIANINVVISEAKQRVNQRLGGSTAEVTEVVFPNGEPLPALLNDQERMQIVGKNLSGNDVKLSLIVQVNGKPGQLVSESVDQFAVDYGADYELAYDEEAQLQVLTVSGWRIGQDKHVTLTKAE